MKSNQCTEVLELVYGISGISYEHEIFLDSCHYILEPYLVTNPLEVIGTIDEIMPTAYIQLINDTLYVYQKWFSDNDPDNYWYDRGNGIYIYDTTYHSYFVKTQDTLYSYRKKDCNYTYNSNFRVLKNSDGQFCMPNPENPIYDTLFYNCEDYPNKYINACWNIENPWDD